MNQPFLANAYNAVYGGAPTGQVMGYPDLNSLQQLPALFVRQKVDLAEILADMAGGAIGGIGGEAITNVEISNTYNVSLTQEDMKSNRKWLWAKEESDACARMVCKGRRAFKLKVGTPVPGKKDTMEERLGLVSSDDVVPVVALERPCFCCLANMTVRDINGRELGVIEESCCNLCPLCPVTLDFKIAGQETYKLSGSPGCYINLCMNCPCRDAFVFEAKRNEGDTPIGEVRNIPNGFCKMCFTSADDYEITFHPSATPDERGLLLAACFFLDYSFFESKNDDSNQKIGGAVGDGFRQVV